MLKNYFIIGCRYLWKQRLFSFINLSGLVISISAAMVVFLIVHHEFSYDKHHSQGDRIYRIVSEINILGEIFHNPGVPIPLAQVVKDQLTGIDEAAGFFRLHNYSVTIPDFGTAGKVIKYQDGAILTDPNYFSIFATQWVAGDPVSALNQPFQVVLSETKAMQYFGSSHPSQVIGRAVIYEDSIETVVTGIIRDYQHLTDFAFQEFISASTIEASGLKHKWYLEHWDNYDSDFQLMVKLSENVVAGTINHQLASLRSLYQSDYHEETERSLLQPLSDIHFNAVYAAFGRPVANKSTLYGLILVAGLLLILGAINYVNLTTALGGQRVKEIGVRKTLGVSRKHLILQFLMETALLTTVAALLAFLLTPFIMGIFQHMLPTGLTDEALRSPVILVFMIAICLLVGLMSGIYPGVILSKYRPITVLKEQLPFNKDGSLVRVGLIVTQFGVATFFIIATWIVSLQIKHALSLDMGFDKHGVVTFFVPDHQDGAIDILFGQLDQIPEIELISRGGASPASTGVQSRDFNYLKGQETIATQVLLKYGDDNYLNVYGIELLAGTNISRSDTVKELIINESFMKRLGIERPEQAIGDLLENSGQSYPIVGVVADFHTGPIRKSIGPAAITNGAGRGSFHVKLADQQLENWSIAVDKMKQVWDQIYPDDVFQYQFYDERVASWYQQDQHTSRLLKWITGIAIFISCLGLLGLVILVTTARTKEIGIRQVLGANRFHLAYMLSLGFLKLILIAIGITIPVTWLIVNDWLENFAYPVELNWWMFVLPALLLVLLALITIGGQVIKVSQSNPIDSLRNE